MFRYNAEKQALRDGAILEQEFCFAIIIRGPLEEAPVYGEVVQMLDANNFLYEPVRIRNQFRNRISG